MNRCPSCQYPIFSDALRCPKCQTFLKAFGHPGIPLYQAEQGTFLCNNCIYHLDNTCNFPQRPYAKSCTLYQTENITLEPRKTSKTSLRSWVYQNRAWLFLIGLFLGCLVITMLTKK